MKRISKALPTLLLLTVLLLLVACKGPVNPSETTTQPTEHEHEYVEEKFPPTCSAEGYSLHFCRLCKDFYIDTPVPMIPHTYTDYVIAPTCSAEGYTSHVCSVCGYTYHDTPTEKAAHTWLAHIVSPTCTENGYTEHTCHVCGESYRDTPTTASGHYYTEEIVRPTGTEQGYTLHTCLFCNDSYQDTYTDPVQRTVAMQFDPMGGLLPDHPRNTYVYETGTQVTLPVPTREGYVFTGWYTEEEAIHKVSNGIWSIAEDSWLYAGWSPITVPLTLDMGEGGQSLGFFGQTLAWGEAIGTLVTPVPRFGYVFAGWYDGDTLVTPETVSHYTEPITLVARYLKPLASGQVVGEKNDGYYWAVYHDGTLRFRTDLDDPANIAKFVIPDNAFRGMSEITAVELPAQVKDIGNYAFADCTALRSISIPGTIEVIRSSILEGCTALTEITVGSGIYVINEDAFKGCSSLSTLTLPLSLYQIYSPFEGCTGLNLVRYEGTAFQWSVIVKDPAALAVLESSALRYLYEVKYPES